MAVMAVMAIGGAVAGGISSIMGGKAEAAAIRQQNAEAHRNWVQANTQKTFNNARDQFQNAQAYVQQLKRNEEISRAANEYQLESTYALNKQATFQQAQLSSQLAQQKASLLQAASKGSVSTNSGTYGALATMQGIRAVSSAFQLKNNRDEQLKNINRQKQNMMTEQTQNVFMPNVQMYDRAPTMGNPAAAENAGMVSGMLQIGTGIAGGIAGMGGGAKSAGTPTSGGSGSGTGPMTQTGEGFGISSSDSSNGISSGTMVSNSGAYIPPSMRTSTRSMGPYGY